MSSQQQDGQVRRRNGAVAALLWVVLVISGAVNAVGALVGLDYPMRMVAGGVAVVCIVLLTFRYVRRNPR